MIPGQPHVLYRVTDSSTLLLVEYGLNFRIVDIAGIIPVEAGIDGFGQGFTHVGLVCSFHALVADTNGVLSDCACFGSSTDRVHLLLV